MADRRQALELGVTEKTFQTACAPTVNLFEQTAEPILLTERRFDYPIVPDIRRPNATEIFSVDEVVSVRPDTQEPVRFEPFYSFRHGLKGGRGQVFWMASRRASGRRDDEGTEMFLSLVDLEQRPVAPDVDSLTVRLTCTNRDLPSRLPFGMESGDFELESGAPVHSIMALRKPTPALRPPTGKSSLWRLVSHLSLNYLSLVAEGREALQEILKLYNFTNSSYSVKQIEGITELKSRPQFARIISENGITFARGTRVDLELDEENFVGGGAYLFASVIEHFLGLYIDAGELQPTERFDAAAKGGSETMATPGRLQDPPVENQRARFEKLERVLREQPFGFDFFQAVRLLGRILADRQPVGQFSNPRTEVVRFGTGADFGFPPSQIAALDWPRTGSR